MATNKEAMQAADVLLLNIEDDYSVEMQIVHSKLEELVKLSETMECIHNDMDTVFSTLREIRKEA